MKTSIFFFFPLLLLLLIAASSEFAIAQKLFSTNSATPWCRGSRRWFLQQNISLGFQEKYTNPNPNPNHDSNLKYKPNQNQNQNFNPNPYSNSKFNKHISASDCEKGTSYVNERAVYDNREGQLEVGVLTYGVDGRDQTNEIPTENLSAEMDGTDYIQQMDRGDQRVQINVGDQIIVRQDCHIDGNDCIIDGIDRIDRIDRGNHITQLYRGDHIDHVMGRGDCTNQHTFSTIRSSIDNLSTYIFVSTKSDTFRTISIVLWLAILFYLLTTTASDYFSFLLEHLSQALKLSPAVAGVTLLAIGNGAPDVFSSVAAFVSSDTSGSIGFGAVLGSALFITTIVAGSVALITTGICKEAGSARINLVCFIRDTLFLLASAGVLMVIFMDAKVYLWEAVCFLCVYVVYAASVWAAEMLENRHRSNSLVLDPLISKAIAERTLPQWIATSRKWQYYHIYSQHHEVELEYLYDKHYLIYRKCKKYVVRLYKYGIERPLALPRLLTIPVIEEERWSRPLAVISCTLAPLFVGCIFLLHCDESEDFMLKILIISGGIGILLGILAFLNTESARPPHRFLWLWLAGGFFMSIVWFYIVADQLVTSLEMLGAIFHINPTILGLTVLAWGNSIGDLVADIALVCSGRNGVQIAIAGCYAGPLFNTVIGLGLSLAVACWSSYPEPLTISDEDGSLFFIIGFLAAGLAWALIMIPLKGMRLSRSFGAGLVLLYCGFLATGMCYGMGWILR